jgi:hypothetical protein
VTSARCDRCRAGPGRSARRTAHPDDQHGAIGQLAGTAVVARVQHGQAWRGRERDPGHPCAAVFTGGDHHRAGMDQPLAAVDGIAAGPRPDPMYPHPSLIGNDARGHSRGAAGSPPGRP